MKLAEFSAFIGKMRNEFRIEHNNMFAFSMAKVSLKWRFLVIIYERYREVAARSLRNVEAMKATTKPGQHPVSAEQELLHDEALELQTRLHLEIDSFYVFAKIMLDDMARAIEYFFEATRSLPIDSHDDLVKRLGRIADTKGLKLPGRMMESAQGLKNSISDYRDEQIAHEKSPRTMRGTIWGGDRVVRQFSTRLNPKDSDRQVESESFEELFGAIEQYVDLCVELFQQNIERTGLKRIGRRATT